MPYVLPTPCQLIALSQGLQASGHVLMGRIGLKSPHTTPQHGGRLADVAARIDRKVSPSALGFNFGEPVLPVTSVLLIHFLARVFNV